VVLFLGASSIGGAGSVISFSAHTAGGLTFLAIGISLAGGFVTGFLAAYAASFANAIPEVAAALLVGALLGLVLSLILTAMEPTVLSLRGYRRPSTREWEGHLLPAMQAVVDAMKLEASPRILVADSPVPNAWAHSRHIVVTTGLIRGLDQDELTAVFAHEVMHWRQGDPLAFRIVSCFGWPVVVMYTLGMWLSGAQYGVSQPGGSGASLATDSSGTPHADGVVSLRAARSVVALIGWLFLWPSWLLIRFVMVPAAASNSRQVEYEADAGAAAAGFGDSLHRALERLAPFEGGRSAWEAVLSATHPPMELRLEALDNAEGHPSPPPEPQRAPRDQVSAAFGILVILLAIALSSPITALVTKALSHIHLHL
jgi:Zn-dependent protease with chaperone function